MTPPPYPQTMPMHWNYSLVDTRAIGTLREVPISPSYASHINSGGLFTSKRTVSFPWGDVQYPWPGGRTLSTFDAGVDDGVFVMLDEFCGASIDGDDDPSWDKAIKGNDSQQIIFYL